MKLIHNTLIFLSAASLASGSNESGRGGGRDPLASGSNESGRGGGRD
eukprot:CAMPEP_0198248602 /NCGR_PEP_ID=MMETSP1447-20131203/351_1 /TAXON_ID=420782 /ORGANISM="Chaetoceros dichaeta, Strain CCMP1751" /LENGTH=46 /DNA_ID= /DNA_START= /DNA_END= /DNA_ORIENTATION=